MYSTPPKNNQELIDGSNKKTIYTCTAAPAGEDYVQMQASKKRLICAELGGLVIVKDSIVVSWLGL